MQQHHCMCIVCMPALWRSGLKAEVLHAFQRERMCTRQMWDPLYSRYSALYAFGPSVSLSRMVYSCWSPSNFWPVHLEWMTSGAYKSFLRSSVQGSCNAGAQQVKEQDLAFREPCRASAPVTAGWRIVPDVELSLYVVGPGDGHGDGLTLCRVPCDALQRWLQTRIVAASCATCCRLMQQDSSKCDALNQ